MVVQRAQATMTYEEFLDWADEDTLTLKDYSRKMI